LWGYSLAFGPDVGGVIGSLKYVGLAGVGLTPHPTYGPTIPHVLFMAFQMMFAVITPALITGAFAERMKFSAYVVFTVLWVTLVYSPLAHWVWGGGWLARLGALDFAGGAVVHINSGLAALAAVLVIGRRRGFPTEPFMPHNLPMTLTGAGLLWFGWFGFNAGSALAANGQAANAFVATHVAGATAAVSWVLIEWLHRGRATTLGAASGAVAGLAGITPGAGFVGPLSALVIGALAGAICYGGVTLKLRFRYDDSLDVFGIHGLSGTFGILATGLFAQEAIGKVNGLFFGNAAQFGIQVVTVLASAAFSFIVTFLILKLVDVTIGLRISEEEESAGLDLSQHSETGYSTA
jgi:Amt family ammonium transporter